MRPLPSCSPTDATPELMPMFMINGGWAPANSSVRRGRRTEQIASAAFGGFPDVGLEQSSSANRTKACHHREFPGACPR